MLCFEIRIELTLFNVLYCLKQRICHNLISKHKFHFCLLNTDSKGKQNLTICNTNLFFFHVGAIIQMFQNPFLILSFIRMLINTNMLDAFLASSLFHKYTKHK